MTLTPLTPSSDQSSLLRPRRLARPEAEELGHRIQQQAALIAEATCELLLMVADFDARDGTRCFVGLKSTAHWLAWACSMTPGTSREHVRVARALPEMPLTVEEFRAGRLSYSKVREITRVVGRVDETMLVEMARAMTASQLARAISTFRAVDGSRLEQDAIREARWQTREDGMVEIRAVLPAEMGAEVVTALDLALDRDGHDPSMAESDADDPSSSGAAEPSPDDLTAMAAEISATPTLEQRKADALHDLARTFLDAEPDDRSGEDRHLVIVEVSAETLPERVPAGTPVPCPVADVPAGTSEPSPASAAVDPNAAGPDLTPAPVPGTADADADPDADAVPAGTPPRCGVVGQGPLEPRTAERLACTGKVAVMITDAGGEVLHLGRSRRLASRAQRRALRLRDGVCGFPGCHQSRHLDAHHTTPWSEGGTTDIEGLALLCRRHHVMVHEGGLRLVPDTARATPLAPRFQVLDRAGHPVQARWPALHENITVRDVTSPRPSTAEGADPERIAATTGGAGFSLADCVEGLCRNVLEPAA